MCLLHLLHPLPATCPTCATSMEAFLQLSMSLVPRCKLVQKARVQLQECTSYVSSKCGAAPPVQQVLLCQQLNIAEAAQNTFEPACSCSKHSGWEPLVL